MLIRLEYENLISPFLQTALDEKPKWMSSALKSTGWWAQGEIKKGIRSKAPGGQKYPELSPYSLRTKLRWGKAASKSPLGKLVQAIGYDSRQAAQGSVLVGWLSRSAVWLGSMQEKGFSIKTTSRMRKKFSQIGSKLSAKSEIIIPARPTFKPMKPIIETGAPLYFNSKIMEYLSGVTERAKAKSRRIYRVYN